MLTPQTQALSSQSASLLPQPLQAPLKPVRVNDPLPSAAVLSVPEATPLIGSFGPCCLPSLLRSAPITLQVPLHLAKLRSLFQEIESEFEQLHRSPIVASPSNPQLFTLLFLANLRKENRAPYDQSPATQNLLDRS